MATTAPQVDTASAATAALRRIVGSQEAVLFLAIVLLLVVVGGINPRYVAERNLESMLSASGTSQATTIG